jgi:arsenate reductase
MKNILFVCIGNCCRSPMAEGFANYYGKGWLGASSAGIHPAGFISKEAAVVMAEKGIDLSICRSKGLSAIPLERMDWIVTLDPALVHSVKTAAPRTQLLHWFLADPIGESLDFFRNVRDQIEIKVLDLLEVVQKEE